MRVLMSRCLFLPHRLSVFLSARARLRESVCERVCVFVYVCVCVHEIIMCPRINIEHDHQAKLSGCC